MGKFKWHIEQTATPNTQEYRQSREEPSLGPVVFYFDWLKSAVFDSDRQMYYYLITRQVVFPASYYQS